MSLTVQPVSDLRIDRTYALNIPEPLRAPAGHVTVITGDSGSGKSVLLRLLAGYHPRHSSNDRVFRAEVRPEPDGEAVPIDAFFAEPTRLSYLPQHSVLRGELTPERALRDWCSILTATYGPDSEVRRFVLSAQASLQQSLFSESERAQLFGPRAPRIKHLSGGQKRRLDVILALCSPAEMVFLDEPDSGLDEARRTLLFRTLVEFAAQHRKVLLLVSHYASRERGAEALCEWRVTRDDEGGGATVTAHGPAPDTPARLPLHAPPEARGDMRLDQFGVYVRQRFAAARNRATLAFLLTPLVLMAVVRLAIYPDPAADGPSLALLFFFAVACFWIGTVQSTGFWSDEHALFSRECRQGASSFAFVAGFVVVVTALLALQTLLGALAIKTLSWSALLQGNWDQIGHDLHIGWTRAWFWGAWAGVNGLAAGLAAATVQHRVWPRGTHPTTAQLLALLLTLSAIVFSHPIIGSRAYERIVENTHAANRLRVVRESIAHLDDPASPVPAIVLAELPVGANPSFHGLWFQGERPRRYRLAPALLDEFQKEAVPEIALNLLWLLLLFTLTLRQAWRMRQGPEYA